MDYLLTSRDWIFYFLQVNLIWCIGFALLYLLLRRASPAMQYKGYTAFHLLLPLGLLVSLLVNIPVQDSTIIPEEATYSVFYEAPVVSELLQVDASSDQGTKESQIFTTVLLLIAGIVLLLLGKFTLQCIHLFRFAGDEDQELKEMVAELSTEIGVARQVQLLLTRFAITPFSFGWRRPLIILPDLVKEKCSPEQVRIILRHELVHIVRQDFLMNLPQKLIRILFVYNPLIHLSDRLIDDAREMICDQQVLKLRGVSRKAYASTLLHMNDVLYPGNPLTAAVPFYRKFSQLKGRITMIKNASTMQTSGFQKLFVPIILLFSFVAITLTALQAAEDKKEQIFESNDQKVKMTSTYVEISRDGQENRYGKDSAEYLMWQKRFSMMEISNEELLQKEALIKADYEANIEQKRRQLEEQRIQTELLIKQLKQEELAAKQSIADRKSGSAQLEQDQQALKEMQQKTTQVIDELQRRVMELSAKLEKREKSGVKSIKDKQSSNVNEMDIIINALRGRLQKDGLIKKNAKYFKFHMEANGIEVNDKRIDDRYFESYRELIEYIKGKKMKFPYTASVTKS